MIGDLIVGIALRFSSNGVFALERLNAAAKAANTTFARSQGLIDAQTAALRRHEAAITRVNTRYREMAALMAGGAALGGAALIGASLSNAAKMQLAMTSVQIASGANAAQMQKLTRMALSTSNITAQSAPTTAQEMATAARAGLGSYGRLTALFPLLAKFADVMYFTAKARGQSLPVTEAVSLGTQFAHLFQAYTPAAMSSMLEGLFKVQMAQPEALNRLLMQGKYFIPLAHSLGMTPNQALMLMASMGQTGFLRGRGGTSIENAIYAAINGVALTGHLQSAKSKALEKLGILTPGGKLTVVQGGKLDWAKFTSTLDRAAKVMSPVEYAALLQAGMGKQATQFMSVYTSPLVQGQLQHFLPAQFARMGSHPIEDAFKKLVPQTLIGAARQAATNLINVGTAVMLPLLPTITAGLNKLTAVLGKLANFFQTHRHAAIGAALVAFAAVGASALFAAKQIWTLNVAIGALGDVAGARDASGAGSFVKRALFGSKFVPAARDAATGRFIAGTSRAATRGLLGWIPEALAAVGGFVARIIPFLLDAGGDMIPIIGWVAAALTAIAGIGALIKNSPSIAAAINIWWIKSQGAIGHTIGVVFGSIGGMVVAALESIYAGIAAATNAFVSNAGLLLTGPVGMQRLSVDMALSQQQAMQQYAKMHGIHEGFGAGFMGGLQSGYNHFVAPSSHVTVNVQNLNLHGSPHDQAIQFLDAIRQPVSRTAGAYHPSPRGFAASALGLP